MNETNREDKNLPQEENPKKPWISLIEGKGSKKAKQLFKVAKISVVIALICSVICAVLTFAPVEDDIMFADLIVWVLLLACVLLFASSFILALIGCIILLRNKQLRLNKKIAFSTNFIIVYLLIILGFILVSYLFYPVSEMQLKMLATNFLEEIYDEVILYKNETGSLPENLDNLLYYDVEKRKVFFRSKPLKGQLYYVSIDFSEDEIKDYDVNKVIHYKIIGDKPVIFTLGSDGKEGGEYEDKDYSYPPRKSFNIPFRDFIKTRFFARTLIYGIPWAFAMSMCLYHIWSRRKDASTSIVRAILFSITFFVFACIVTAIILVLHIYPHH